MIQQMLERQSRQRRMPQPKRQQQPRGQLQAARLRAWPRHIEPVHSQGPPVKQAVQVRCNSGLVSLPLPLEKGGRTGTLVQSYELTECLTQNDPCMLPNSHPSPFPFNSEDGILRRLPISLETAKGKLQQTRTLLILAPGQAPLTEMIKCSDVLQRHPHGSV